MSADYDGSPETRQRLYERTKEELVSKQVANSTSYDTAILTLSSAFLALSITFVKDVIGPLTEAIMLWMLFAAWCSFAGAIISTVVSFMVGQSSYSQLIQAAKKYYLDGESDAHEMSVKISKRIERLNLLNGCLFIIGTALILIFTVSNFSRIAAMPTSKPSTPTSEQRGQPTLPFQTVPPSPPTRPASAPASESTPPATQKGTGA